jgi:23S rRNA pseudouridine1911/1915/1917 synthase
VRLTVTGRPRRLDRFLVAAWPDAPLGRRRLAALLAKGNLRVNGRPARKGTLVRDGDLVTLHLPALPADRLMPTPANLCLVHVDPRLVAVDKPPGLPTLGGTRPGPSLAAMLLADFPEMALIDPRRGAGLAHRLDTATSGLLIAARTPEAYARLRREFHRKAIDKHYLAIVHGRLNAPSTITQPLQRHVRRRGRMLIARPADRRAWPAVTDAAPLRVAEGVTLVHLRMRTGVTHQLRVHLAAIGHPIVGDTRYGKPLARSAPHDGMTRATSAAHPWHYLHALGMCFDAVDLPPRLSTRFPRHWVPMFEELRWPTKLAALLPRLATARPGASISATRRPGD